MQRHFKNLLTVALGLVVTVYFLLSLRLLISHQKVILETFGINHAYRQNHAHPQDHTHPQVASRRSHVFSHTNTMVQHKWYLPDDIPLVNHSTSQKIPEKFFTAARYCNNYTRQFVISNQGLCQDQQVLLVIGVRSHAAGYESRALIRHTWGSLKEFQGLKVITIFLLGIQTEPGIQEAVEQENKVNGDVVQADFLDTYSNLTIKTQSAIRWLRDYCRHSQYFMMADMDMFVDVFKLISYLNNINKTDHTYTLCYNEYQQWPRRPPNYVGHESMPKDEYSTETYAPYCWGAAYVATIPLLNRLYIASLHTPRLRIDDVWTGILAERAGIELPSWTQYIHYIQGWQSHAGLTDPDYFNDPVIFAVFDQVDKHRRISNMWQRVASHNRIRRSKRLLTRKRSH